MGSAGSAVCGRARSPCDDDASINAGRPALLFKHGPPDDNNGGLSSSLTYSSTGSTEIATQPDWLVMFMSEIDPFRRIALL
jgi:hypothetical protein